MMYDDKVKQVMQEVLDRLEKDNGGLTLNLGGDLSYTVTEEDLLRDVEIFADEVFDGETARQPDAIEVTFRNGQKFRIAVKEIH